MLRSFLLLALSAALLAQQPNQHSKSDPAFEKVPFEQWLSEGVQTGFRWTLRVTRAELTFHQRLMARIDVGVDGRDLKNRRDHGEIVFFIQLTDGDGNLYRDHGSVELSKLDKNIEAANLEYSQPAFFLPGDYRLAVAILDTASGEHSARQAQFRVSPPKHDPLSEAWRDLPAVAFIGKEEGPDAWYLPAIRGRLQWAAAAQAPARLNIILNVAPSAPVPGSRQSQRGELEALLPTLKIISQTGSASVSAHVELLDLARRRAVFQQNEVHDLDWSRLKKSLGEADTASIDIRSLSARHHDAQFFVAQARRLVSASEKPCVLVVLTKPVAFESGEDLEPISLEGLPACRVIYVRYRAEARAARTFSEEMRGRGLGPRRGGPMGPVRPAREAVDQLAATLKPLRPRVFDVGTPEQMARAIVEIEKALLTSGGPASR